MLEQGFLQIAVTQPASPQSILEIFAAFNQVGVTVLIATHDEALIGRFARRVLRLAGGQLVE